MSFLEINRNVFTPRNSSDLIDDFKNRDACVIPKLDLNEVTYEQFFTNYLYRNKPCILKNVGKDWFSSNMWQNNDKPNFEFLSNVYGDMEASVANCNVKYFNAQEKTTQTVKNFINYWSKFYYEGYPSSMELLYLKDWHFTRDYPKDDVYRVPHVFASDWLNEYYTQTEQNDDYRFVYMGPKGTWTPFHADVFSSFSWSVNICGRKRWKIYMPGQNDYLKDRHGNLAYDIESDDLNDVDKYPNSKYADKFYDVVQNAQEAIFVPSGWHHQVWNLDNTISINHNWINGCNIEYMWSSLCTVLSAVQLEIADCKDMDGWAEDCQLILGATFGMDVTQFYNFLKFIARVRLEHCKENKSLIVYGQWELGVQHLLFDLKQIKTVLLSLSTNKDVTCLSSYCKDDVNVLIDDIDSVINGFD